MHCFHRKGVSRDAEHYGKAQDIITSCFAYQTGRSSVFLPAIDLIRAVFKFLSQHTFYLSEQHFEYHSIIFFLIASVLLITASIVFVTALFFLHSIQFSFKAYIFLLRNTFSIYHSIHFIFQSIQFYFNAYIFILQYAFLIYHSIYLIFHSSSGSDRPR